MIDVLELEILKILNKYGYGRINATKNNKEEFEYDGVIEIDLKKHDEMVKELKHYVVKKQRDILSDYELWKVKKRFPKYNITEIMNTDIDDFLSTYNLVS